MMSPIQKMPTLGCFNKVVCDCLGLWASNNESTIFNVPAKEEERRKALRDAFAKINKDGRPSGSLDDLISVTTEMAPQQRREVKKSKTIQGYTAYYSKKDFSKYYEFTELKNYIDIFIDEKFSQKQLSVFASKFHDSSIMHYREFIREHTSRPTDQSGSYVFFIKHILGNLIESLVDETSSANVFSYYDKNKPWPLRSFVDLVSDLCGVSLHQLHQFHEIKLNRNWCDQDIWSSDLISQPINTKSKQVIDRISKNRKIKWDSFYSTIKPFVCLLPEDIDEEVFSIKAYSAFLTHNLAIHISELDSDELHKQMSLFPANNNGISPFPISDKIYSFLDVVGPPDVLGFQSSMGIHREFTQRLRLLNSSWNRDVLIPSMIDFTFGSVDVDFPIVEWAKNLNETPRWISEWILARDAYSSGNSPMALQHFKTSLEEAKYVAGPLFFPLYIQICAFCKNQYQELKKRNVEHLFDDLYEPLGGKASNYVELLGYTPIGSRNPKTLMPNPSALVRNSMVNHKINAMAKSFN